MNFKNALFLIALISLSGCGVKAPPLKYSETIIDSYTQEYTGSAELTPEEIERTKEKPPVSSIESQIDPNKDKDEDKNNSINNRK